MDINVNPQRFINYGWWATRSRREKRTIQAVIFSCIVLVALIFSLTVSYEELDTKKKNDFEDPDSFSAKSRNLIMNAYFENRWKSKFPSENENEVPIMRTTSEKLFTVHKIPPFEEGSQGNTIHKSKFPQQKPNGRPISTSKTLSDSTPNISLMPTQSKQLLFTLTTPYLQSTSIPHSMKQPVFSSVITDTTIPTTTTTTSITIPPPTTTTTTTTITIPSPPTTAAVTTPITTTIASTSTFLSTLMVSPPKSIISTSSLSLVTSIFKLTPIQQSKPVFSTSSPEQLPVNSILTPVSDSSATITTPSISGDTERNRNNSYQKRIDMDHISSQSLNLTAILNISQISGKKFNESFDFIEGKSTFPSVPKSVFTTESNLNYSNFFLGEESSTSNIAKSTLADLNNTADQQQNNSLNFMNSYLNISETTNNLQYLTNPSEMTSTSLIQTTNAPLNNECVEDECLIVAKSFKLSIDENTAACDDFYQYICGNWEQTTISPPIPLGISGVVLTDRIKNDIKDLLMQEALQYDSKAEKNVKTLYKSCVFSEKYGKNSLVFIQRTLSALTSIAQTKKHNSKKPDLNRLVTELIPLYSNYLLPIGVVKDQKSVSNNVLHVGILPLQLVSKENYDSKLPYFAAFKRLLTEIANEMQVQSIVNKVIGLELLLSQITPSVPTDVQQKYNPIPISELEEYSQLSWRKIFQAALDLIGKNVTIRDNEVVVVESPEYIKNLLEVFKNTEEHDLIDFVLMRFVMSKIDAMPDPFYKMYQDYKHVTSGISADNRPLSCVLFVGNLVPGVISKIYARRYFSDADKYKNIHVPKMIHAAVIKMVSHIHWMDQVTKWEALKKLYSMLQMIGSDENLSADPFIEQFQFNENFMSNLFTIDKYKFIQTFSKLREINSRGRWSLDSHPFEIKALYTPEQNSIYIPAVMFQLPLFHDDLPLAMQFGALGSVVGHAYIHSLDLQGSQFDDNGNMKNWWSEQTKRNFLTEAESLNSDPIKELLPQDILESSADIGGLKIALQAYHKMMQEFNLEPLRLPGMNFTSQQLFFVSYAHAWCNKQMMQNAMDSKYTKSNMSGKSRVIVTLQNTEEFAMAFHCKPTDFMNPKRKTTLW
ncbi:membrane metallo-endopeptidase-like 1 [Octopus vulgaris]|uniref:Membrane metallo-endopeptidase-like 1 n=1 Tax=Octopus vulgaris TaxID=6645 RepID=A0AA36BB20_OCTVU|nr:membrane metallo-endopeptidase-like 1 [Octopus vulgaris]